MHPESVKRILVRGPNWIGDAVMSEPALSEVGRLFPGAEIHLLVRPAIAELFKGHPAVHRILVYEHQGRHAGLSGKWALAQELRRFAFDLGILFQNAFEAALLVHLAGIPNRYGYATDGRGWLLTESIPVPRTKGHHSRYYLDLLRPLGADGTGRGPRLFVSSDEEEAMTRRLEEMGVALTDVVIGLNPGSMYGSAKRWRPERFAETADRLARTHGARVVLVGAPGEEALGKTVAEAMRTDPILLSGRTSVRELMAVVARCRLFLTNDTGPMHIAAAFGVPIVAIFGPTDWAATAPFGNNHRIVREPVECSPCLLRECPIDHRCMTGVSVELVYQAAVQLLGPTDAEQAYPSQPLPLAARPLPLQGVTVFLDRDGTLSRDTGYVRTPEELEMLPGVVEALGHLNRAGARLVLLTNQSGIARGLLSRDGLQAIHARLRTELHAGGAWLDAIYYCPHHPDDGCLCRKPQTGMVMQAMMELQLDLSRAYIIGDQARDLELAKRIGIKSVLVTTGQTGDATSLATTPDYATGKLADAVDWIVRDAQGRHSSFGTRETAGDRAVARFTSHESR